MSASIVGPDGEITLYEDIPFSNNYSHSIYFKNSDDKTAYFTSHKIDGGSLDSQNYVKTENGKIRIKRDSNRIQNACYMSWKNPGINRGVPGGGTDTHQADTCYAFITDIAFISPMVSEITYEIDVIQTYVICPGPIDTDRIELQDCLIDRRHYATCNTNPTVNLEPESIPITKKLVSNASASNTDNKLLGTGYNTLLVFTKDYIDYNEQYATDSADIAAWLGMKAGGLLQGLFIEVVKASDRQQFLEYVLTKENKAEAIVSIVAVPDTLVDATSDDILLLANNNKYDHDGSVDLSNWNAGMDGIAADKIVNKKLFTSPYNTLLMTDGTQTKELEFEYIGSYQDAMDDTVELQYKTVLSCQPNAQIQFLIKNYGRSGITPDYNLQASFLLSDLQKVPWSSDSFTNWLGNNGVQVGVNSLTNMLSGAGGGFAVGGIPGAVGGAVLGLGTGLVNAIGSAGQAAVKPPTLQGSCSANPLMAVGEYDVHLYRSCLSKEDVERIDDYFTRFGYACNRIGNPINSMVPAINALGFCYIKTTGCLALGKGPASYLRKVEDIFNKGITFWDKGRVGNYEYK